MIIEILKSIGKILESLASVVLTLVFTYFLLKDMWNNNLTQWTVMIFMILVASELVDLKTNDRKNSRN